MWRTIKPYVRATRWKINLFLVLLVLVSYRVAQVSLYEAILPTFVVFWIACSTMVQNDFRDRRHDIKKGKDHAALHSVEYRWLASSMWLLSVVMAVLAFGHLGFWAALLLLADVIIGLVYSELLLVPGLPNVLVSLASASAVLFPLASDSSLPTAHHLWLLFFVVLGTVHGREVIKDLQDRDIDSGHKWTWAQKGSRAARAIATVSFVVGTLPIFPILPSHINTAIGKITLALPLPGIVGILNLNDGDDLLPAKLRMIKLANDTYMAMLLVVMAMLPA